jgi:hypothetical protein
MMATIIRAGTEGTGEGEYNLKRIGVAIDEAEEDCDHILQFKIHQKNIVIISEIFPPVFYIREYS